jgi:DNA-binding PadR family transcriptional regulator
LRPAECLVLLALVETEHDGHGLVKELRRVGVRLGPGALYGTICRLLAAGLIQEADSEPERTSEDRPRRRYRTTSLGRGIVRIHVQLSQALAGLAHAQRILSGAS